MRQHLVAAGIAAALGLSAQSAFADDATTFGGKLYADFSNISQDKNGNTTDADGTGIDVKRFYFVVDHKFDDVWSADLTTDFNYVSNDGQTQVFVKKAYVQAKLDNMFIARLGSADMPWIPYVEGWYGYRYVENTLTDRLHFANSADWGLHALSSTNGMFNYAVSAVNGGGYKNPSRSSGMDFEGRIGFQPMDGLAIAVGGYSGDRGKDVNSTPTTHTASRVDFLAAYKGGPLRLGVEYFSADNWNNVQTTGPKDSADGYSAWAQYDFSKEWALFGRYDHAKISKDLNPSLKDVYYNAGLQWQARKGVKLAFVYKHDKLDDNTGANTKSNEIGVWGEVAF